MQKRHTDRESYFDEQSQTSKNYYIPYIKEVIGHIPDKVLEVGCGEGGSLSNLFIKYHNLSNIRLLNSYI